MVGSVRLVIVVALAALLPLAVTSPATAQQEPAGAPPPGRRPTPAEVEGRSRPPEPNPYLAFLPPGAQPDYAYWRSLLQQRSQLRAQEEAATLQAPLVIQEEEPDELRGLNDTLATAQPFAGFGTGEGEQPEVEIEGTLAPLPPPVAVGPFPEDDGAIPLANPTGLSDQTLVVTTSGTIGDGPHGSAGTGTGDFDFYAITATQPGEVISVDVTTPEPVGETDLDPSAGVWDSNGTLLAFNEDQDPMGQWDPFLTFAVPAPGDYFVSIGGGIGSPLPVDPFDPASGQGVFTEGTYDLQLGLDAFEIDVFSFELDAGDVVGTRLEDAGTNIRLYDSAGVEVVGSSQDLSAIYPEDTQLPGGGNAVSAHVADTAGRYHVAITGGAGDYEALLRARRPPLEREPDAATQTLFLDFDGAEIQTAIFGGPGIRRLSPLSAFLGGWGLGAESEDAVIDAIVASVEESLSQDLRVKGRNGDRDATGEPGDFDVEILNSRDHPDPFGQENVSRIIVGGTIAESGIPTVGIAQTIDPGNFDQTESALVLLDLLSQPDGPLWLNQFVGPETDVVELVGTGVGNIAAHEAGHFFGNFHTDQFDELPNLEDQGGNLPGIVGVGPDGIFGTEDDVDVDFGEDRFVPNEGLTGIEDTLNTIAFGLSTGLGEVAPEVPGAPSGVTAFPGRRAAWVSWMPPEDDGGAEVTAYVVRAFRQGSARVLTETFPAGQTQAIVEGLRAGSTYTFTVAAVNEVGEGPQSAPSAPVTTRPRA